MRPEGERVLRVQPRDLSPGSVSRPPNSNLLHATQNLVNIGDIPDELQSCPEEADRLGFVLQKDAGVEQSIWIE
jgi:hypothetical protein